MPATGGERHSRWERCDAERLPVRDKREVFGRRESVYRGGKIRTKRVRDEEDIRGTRRISKHGGIDRGGPRWERGEDRLEDKKAQTARRR